MMKNDDPYEIILSVGRTRENAVQAEDVHILSGLSEAEAKEAQARILELLSPWRITRSPLSYGETFPKVK